MNQTITQNNRTYTIWKYIVGGFIAGILTAALNNILYFFLPLIEEVKFPSSIDELALSLGSFIPPILATIFYYLVSSTNYNKGTKIYISIVVVTFLLSIVIQFFPELLEKIGLLSNDNIPKNLALLTVPFHITTALVALVFIPQFVGSKED